MDVTCDKCRTEYEFDDSLVSEAGTTVKCTNCGHLFRIFKPGTPESSRLSSWMLKQPDGSVYTFERLATLQRWIAEGKASRGDLVSRTGEGWKSLGEIAELAPFFEAADAAQLTDDEEDDGWPDDGPTIQRAPEPRPLETAADKSTMTGYDPPKAPPPSGESGQNELGSAATEPGERSAPVIGRAEPDLSGVPASRPSGGWQEGQLPGDSGAPAWTDRPSSRPTDPALADDPAWTEGRVSRNSSTELLLHDDDDEPDHKGRGLKVAVPLALVALVALAAGGIWLFRPDLFRSWADQLEQADRELHRGDETDGLTRAGLAEVYTVWAQYYLDEVADGRLRAKTAGPTEAAALNARAQLRDEDFDQKLGQARRFVDAAVKNAPDAAEAHRAAADYHRLAGDLERAKTHIAKALDLARSSPDAMPETEYTAAMVDLTAGTEPTEVVGRLRSVVEGNAKLIRCHYRLARLLAARGQRAEALESLGRVLELNPDHERARSLRASLRGSEPLIVAVASATIATALATSAPAPDAGPADAAAPDATAVAEAAEDGGAEPEGTPDARPTAVATGDGVPSSPEALIQRASKLQRSGNRQACSLFKQADRIRPGHPEVLTGLGYCAMDGGRTGSAISQFRRALSSSGSYGPALIGMAEASRAQGAKRQALQYYRRYLSSHPGGGSAAMARRWSERIETELGEGEEPEPPVAGTGGPPAGAPSGGSEPPEEPPEEPAPGTPERPSVTRETEDRTPEEPRSDSLALDGEPPLRPGEDLD